MLRKKDCISAERTLLTDEEKNKREKQNVSECELFGIPLCHSENMLIPLKFFPTFRDENNLVKR